MSKKEPIFFYKEKRETAITVRLPTSVVKKIKRLAKNYNYSQSQVIETVILKIWQEENLYKDKNREE